MILRQYYLRCLAHASYLLGDEASGTAIVVDPQRDIEQYLQDAAAHQLEIRHVFLTHFHADFLAGHLELRDRCGARIHLGARAQAEYAFEPMADGAALEFPGLRLVVLETPGHTIESISILVFDRNHDERSPRAVLTGDTLFLGDVGRPDLRASLGWTAEQLGSHLFDSLHTKLLPLPDEVLVYPAHGAGSLCGKQLSSETVSSLGEQRRSNYALQPLSREQFLRLVTSDQPPAPAYFTFDAILNTRERATLDTALERGLNPLTLEQLRAAQAAGAQLLDVREPAAFAAAHLTGAVNVGLGGAFATWAGTVLDATCPLAIVAEPGGEVEAATRLGRIGFDRVQGFLAGGMVAASEVESWLAATPQIAAAELAAELKRPHPPVVVDVRAPAEYAAGHIAGSRSLPLNRWPEGFAALPPIRLAVHCAAGYRSSIAASLLQMLGRDDLAELTGGFGAWQAAKLPVATVLSS